MDTLRGEGVISTLIKILDCGKIDKASSSIKMGMEYLTLLSPQENRIYLQSPYVVMWIINYRFYFFLSPTSLLHSIT